MRGILRPLIALAVVALAGHALAAPAQGDLPACAPSGSVPMDAESLLDGWLSKSDPETVRRSISAVTGGARWEGDTLFISCTIAGSTTRTRAVRVAASGNGVPEAGIERGPRHAGVPLKLEPDRRPLAALARRSGHTPAELEVLASKYAQLAGAYFRTVRDADGAQVSEKDLILRKHRRMAGIDVEAEDGNADEAGGDGELSEAESRALEAKIDAAQERGDTAAVARLALEAHGKARPALSRAARRGKDLDQRSWRALETAYPELSQAAYRTSISFGIPSCLTTCSPTVLPGR